MTILIGDGKGGGGPMEVRENRAQVDAQIETVFEKHAREGEAYSWTNVGYDMTAADTILAVRNTSSSKNLHITKVSLHSGLANVAEHHVTQASAALAGTVVTGVNLNFTSGNVAEADSRADETTNSSQGTIILNSALEAVIEYEIDWGGALILGTNDTYAIDFTIDDTTSLPRITIWGYFETRD